MGWNSCHGNLLYMLLDDSGGLAECNHLRLAVIHARSPSNSVLRCFRVKIASRRRQPPGGTCGCDYSSRSYAGVGTFNAGASITV